MFGRLRSLGQVALEALDKRRKGAAPLPVAPPKPKPLPPVFLFVDGARGRDVVPKIEALCTEHGIVAQLRDVGDDEAMREFVLREARIDRDDLPTLFVASTHLGGHANLVARDAAGTLAEDLRKAR